MRDTINSKEQLTAFGASAPPRAHHDSHPNHPGEGMTALLRDLLAALRSIVHAIDVQSRRVVQRCGLTGPQLAVLTALPASRAQCVGDLARTLCVSEATASGVVRRLETKGYVRRQRDPADRRRVLVELTGLGARARAAAPTQFDAEFIQQFGALRAWEQTLLVSSAQRLGRMMEGAERRSRRVMVPAPDAPVPPVFGVTIPAAPPEGTG
jgi:DNA-binding MarR family transcriptional regulator